MRYTTWLLGWMIVLLVGCNNQPDAPVAALPATPWRGSQPTLALPASPTVETRATRPAESATRVVPTVSPPATVTPTPTRTATALPPTATRTATPLPTVTWTATLPPPTVTRTATPLPPTAEVAAATATRVAGVACGRPPDDYRRVQVRGHTLSARTVAMLDNAQALYGGRGSMRLVIQGSYDPGLGASFGTHDAGGAVDVWAVDPSNTDQLLSDIPQMVQAMRQAGFAAWFRSEDMLYDGMYPHIHAIAVGDRELSQAAAEQLTGAEGYFRGRNGLRDVGFTGPDPHGGPVLCDWMEALGFQGLPYVAPTAPPAPTLPAAAVPQANVCQVPGDDYTRVTWDGQLINQRTLGMLRVAQALYGGPGTLLWVTQGSYADDVAASFGTHAGGGAVDLSIRHPQTSEFLYGETERMVRALRQAGFAAWYRSPAEGFTPHIHAIAVGDVELSDAAEAQLSGEQGYFRGRNALPDERAGPDLHGGPIVCAWMEALGYGDWR